MSGTRTNGNWESCVQYGCWSELCCHDSQQIPLALMNGIGVRILISETWPSSKNVYPQLGPECIEKKYKAMEGLSWRDKELILDRTWEALRRSCLTSLFLLVPNRRPTHFLMSPSLAKLSVKTETFQF